jgi:hypothetical protein
LALKKRQNLVLQLPNLAPEKFPAEGAVSYLSQRCGSLVSAPER